MVKRSRKSRRGGYVDIAVNPGNPPPAQQDLPGIGNPEPNTCYAGVIYPNEYDERTYFGRYDPEQDAQFRDEISYAKFVDSNGKTREYRYFTKTLLNVPCQVGEMDVDEEGGRRRRMRRGRKTRRKTLRQRK